MNKYDQQLDDLTQEIEDKKIARRNHRIRDIASIVLILAGIVVIAIPIIGKLMANNQQASMLDAFYDQLEASNTESIDVEEASFDEALIWGSDVNNHAEPLIVDNDQLFDGTGGSELEESSDLDAMPVAVGVIEIDKIDLKYPVGEGVDLGTLKFVIGHMPDTAPLNAVGNSVMAGHRSHSFGTFFNRLDELNNGDEIIVTSADGSIITYEIYDKYLVEPTDLSVLKNNDEFRIITLITCDPVIDPDKRLIIQAVDSTQLSAME